MKLENLSYEKLPTFSSHLLVQALKFLPSKFQFGLGPCCKMEPFCDIQFVRSSIIYEKKILTWKTDYKCYIKGIPFEKSQKEMAVALRRRIFDPTLVKPKCV